MIHHVHAISEIFNWFPSGSRIALPFDEVAIAFLIVPPDVLDIVFSVFFISVIGYNSFDCFGRHGSGVCVREIYLKPMDARL